MKNLIMLSVVLIVVSFTSAASAQVIGGEFVTHNGEITVTVMEKNAGHNSVWGYVDPDTGEEVLLGNTNQVGESYQIPNFGWGKVLRFWIHNLTINRKFYTGPASNNDDGVEHCRVFDLDVNYYEFQFEDLPKDHNGYDGDMNDLIFTLDGPAEIITHDDPVITIDPMLTTAPRVYFGRYSEKYYDSACVLDFVVRINDSEALNDIAAENTSGGEFRIDTIITFPNGKKIRINTIQDLKDATRDVHTFMLKK